MRAFALLITLCFATPLSADAVAGRTHILVEGRQPWWVPVEGGTPVPLDTSWGLAVSVATDGEHFLVAGGAEGHRIIAAFYEEGERAPFRVITLETESGGHAPVAFWDGTRYVVMWAGPRNEARGVTMTAAGVITRRFEVPQFQMPRAVTSNRTQVLVLTEESVVQSVTRTIFLRAALLNPDLALETSFTLGNTPATFQYAHNQPHLRTLGAIPLGARFYVVAARGDGNGNDEIAGFRVTAEGTVIDEKVLDSSARAVFDADLVPSGEWLMVIFKRAGVRPLTAVFINENGAVVGPQEISGPIAMDAFPEPAPSAVRLKDGSLVFVRIENGAGIVTPLRDSPHFTRRRATRR